MSSYPAPNAADPSSSHVPKPDRSSTSHFSRTLSASSRGYFSGFSSRGEVAPYSHVSTPGTPAVGDVIGGPTPFQRFLSLGRARKDWDVQFPPPHWGVDDEHKEETTMPQDGPLVVLPDYPASPAELVDPAVTDPALEESVDPPPEPTTLAGRIQALLTKASIPSPSDAPLDEVDSSQPPTHPPPQIVSDPKLVTLLSSPAVMNGTFSKGGQTVWTVLDRLRTQLPAQGSPTSSASGFKVGDHRQNEEVLDDDDSGVMLYGPLLPGDGSQVELAKSRFVTFDEESSEERTGPNKQPASKTEPLKELKGKLEGVWPFGGKIDDQANQDPSNARVYFQPTKSKRVWIPSPDKISIQVMWWGYRIYLPPPVLEILDNKQLEGAKRAAMLTTALKYALNRVPIAMVPAQARPAMKLLKAFTPYLGYVGGFVAWSWGAVKSFDNGNGVTLTATWLLTIAVIPSTWEEQVLPKIVHAKEKGRSESNV